MNFSGPARKLQDADLPRIGAKIGCGEDELHAFLDVETLGGGYDGQGRPKMLFEPHVFYRNLGGPARQNAIAQGLAYPNWGEKPYPKDSYPRLKLAMDLDPEAAIRSASWGIGQVLGENHVAAGYDTAEAMVQAFIDLGEAEQLEAAVRFIKYNGLDDELRAHNFAAFSRGYNGPGYAKHGYHTKLEAAFKKWAAVRDTPWAPTSAETLRMAIDATPEKPVIVAPAVIKPSGQPSVIVRQAPQPSPAVAAAVQKPGFWTRFWQGLSSINDRGIST